MVSAHFAPPDKIIIALFRFPTVRMKDVEQSRRLLREQIAATETELQRLKEQLAELEQEPGTPTEAEEQAPNAGNWPLLQDEYRRYGRQMIVSQIGLKGQLSLRNAAVLLIGAGGLGCPAALYLAGAGVGKLGFVDGDRVEHSNLHRQVLHRTRNTGKFKVDSAIEYLKELNPHPTYVPYRSHLDSQNAPDIFAKYDVVLDCTDNPATRYLISDTAVVTGIPVISASALRTEGQLMILNYPPRRPGDESGGPCYRCVFPKPPPADSVVSCADGGIIGPVVGMMGVMQALETIRVLTTPADGMEVTDSNRIVPTLHIFSAYSTPPFRNVRLRRRRAKCMACSENASISVESLRAGSTDYVQFCGSSSPVSLLTPSERVGAKEFEGRYYKPCSETSQAKGHLIDVRDEVQFGICSLPTSLNIPISTILASFNSTADEGELPSWLPSDIATDNSTAPINIVCRLGNDSQTAVDIMKRLGLDRGGKRYIGDINGGLNAWRRDVDPDFPDY